jgi:outer membrane protein OmpA-like peptidoglycan-associated protein
MKAALHLCFFLLIGVSSSVLAQDVFSPYYVVIGAFNNEVNAQKYCAYAHEQNLPAVYAYNDERKMFYVYVRATQTQDIADDIRNRLRAASVFKDAWVFNGVLSGSDLLAKRPPPAVEEKAGPEPVTEQNIPDPVASVPEESTSSSVPEQTAPQVEAPRPVGKPFVFRLVNKETGSPVDGLVRLQESDRAMQYRGVNGNEVVYVPAPANRSGKWVVICHALGFREYRKALTYEEAADFNGASVGTEDEIIIPLALERVRRGDYIEMDAVKFFNNAALFTPGSERQLDELVALMEENPEYQIRLHGHTNGNQPRDIVTIGSSTDFFNPHTSNAKSHTTAKELSLSRAELVKAYLISKGINGERITTKGEGGKQMIVDPRGTLAGMNDRVEVEVRKH